MQAPGVLGLRVEGEAAVSQTRVGPSNNPWTRTRWMCVHSPPLHSTPQRPRLLPLNLSRVCARTRTNMLPGCEMGRERREGEGGEEGGGPWTHELPGCEI